MPKKHKKDPCTLSLFSGLQKNDAKTLSSILDNLSPVNFANAAVVAFVQLHNSRCKFHCYAHHEPMPTQKSAWKWQLWSFLTSSMKDYEGYSLMQTSFTEPPNKAPWNWAQKWEQKSTDRAFPNIKLNSVATTAVNQNVTDTCIKHKGEWHNTSHKWQHQFPKRNSSADDNQLTQFLFAAGLGNKTKLTLSLRLQLFRLIHSYLVSTCVSFLVSWSSTLNPSGKCCCTLTVWLCHSRSHFWDSFLCWLPRKHHWSACQDIQFVSVWWGDWLILVENCHYHFSENGKCPCAPDFSHR